MKLAYTIKESSAELGSSPRFVWKLIERGELASFKAGRKRLIPGKALHEFVERKLAEQSERSTA